MKPKLAREYSVGDPFPRNYPWLSDQDCFVDDIVDEADDLRLFTIGDGREFTCKSGELVPVPVRTNTPGLPPSHLDWSTVKAPPVPFAMAYGDIIGGWRVLRMQPHSPRVPTVVRVRIENVKSGQILHEICGHMSVFIPGTHVYIPKSGGESILQRDMRPERGPYFDIARPGVVYWLLVHPTGKGRWLDEIPKFFRETRPGEYRMRPPSVRSDWRRLKFDGVHASMRHPSDPSYRR